METLGARPFAQAVIDVDVQVSLEDDLERLANNASEEEEL